MKPAEIVAMVAGVCRVTVAQVQSSTSKQDVVFARYIITTLLLEDKQPNKVIIDQLPGQGRITTLYRSKYMFNSLISYHREFKALYLECIRQYAIATGDL